MVVKTITKDVPDTAFALKKKIKVYAADKGTMNDLIDKRYYGKRGIFGSYSSSVKANDDKSDIRDPYEKLLDEYNYGNPALAQALTALLPPERVIDTPDTPKYKLIGSGYLSGGLTYEDFAGEKNGTHYAVRYYFNGNRLVKIATFSYDEDSNGIKDYTKTTVDITEFSNTPDQTYLSLPESLKDKTKRNYEILERHALSID